ncbi:hypothetical protein [Flavobacterium sp. HNIBRBA15423]|uniref:hypothetical protein n=1 Tax=Flavobacterium sp. HNIBRBA15423 TaxID=3458683 RepID=UPI004043B8FB
MKKIKLLSFLLLILFFTNCEKEEVATEMKKDNTASISSSRISISELYNEIQSPEIKTILQNQSFYKFSNDSFSRINDENVTFIKIQKRDSLTTYILNLNSYSQQNPYFLKFIITKNYNETEKAGYIKYIPATPIVLLDLKSFTGEAQILNNELEITASTHFINGVKQEHQSKTENLSRGRCRDLISIVEVKCSHSGEHGVGESCSSGFINDAHYEIYITTTCNDPSTPVEIIDDTSNPNLYNDGAGGSITDVLENILTPEELLWWNNSNANTKNTILNYLNPRVNDGKAWIFVKEAIKALKDGGEVDFYNEIIYLVNKPCQNQIIKDIMAISSPFTNLIKQTFNSSENVNLKFSNGTIQEGSAYTNPFYYGNNNNFTISILFDNTFLDTSTDLGIIATTLHELVHAYLMKLYLKGELVSVSSNYNDLLNAFIAFYDNQVDDTFITLDNEIHNAMKDFIDKMGNSIYNYAISKNINVTPDFCVNLAWGTMSGTELFNEVLTPTQQLINNNIYAIEQDNIQSEGAKGIPCN